MLYNNNMRGILLIIRWEISRIYSNWKRAAAIFIVPAAVMMLALTIFPYLINYMSTGSISEKPILVVNPPESFTSYIEETEGTTVYTYDFMTLEEFTPIWNGDEDWIRDFLRTGSMFVFFADDGNKLLICYNGSLSIASSKAASFI